MTEATTDQSGLIEVEVQETNTLKSLPFHCSATESMMSKVAPEVLEAQGQRPSVPCPSAGRCYYHPIGKTGDGQSPHTLQSHVQPHGPYLAHRWLSLVSFSSALPPTLHAATQRSASNPPGLGFYSAPYTWGTWLGGSDRLRFKNTGHNTRKAVHVKKLRNNVKHKVARARPTITSQGMRARPVLTRVCSIRTIQRTWLEKPESWEENV